MWIELIWLKTEGREGSCEHGNEHSGDVKYKNFLTSCENIWFSTKTLIHGIGWLVGSLVGLLV